MMISRAIERSGTEAVPRRPLRAYMVWEGPYPEEGAVLVFAFSAREAKRVGWPVLLGWGGGEWLDIRVRWLRDGARFHEVEGATEPYAIESPASCDSCELWYPGGLTPEGFCEYCEDDRRFEEEEEAGVDAA